jgi:exosortase
MCEYAHGRRAALEADAAPLTDEETLETTALEVAEQKQPGELTIGQVIQDRTWQAIVVIGVLATALIYWRTMSWEWEKWWITESEYSHGILIPFISGFIIWFNWKRISAIRVRPSAWGFLPLALALLTQYASHRCAQISISGMTIPLMLVGGSLILFGKKATWQLLFPILFLYFMLYPPTSILSRVSFLIQMKSTYLATLGLKGLGFDVSQEGQKIHMPSITLQVVAACSGIRTLVMMLSFGVFMSYMLVGPLWGRLSLVAMIPPLALITNSIRILVVALVGEYYGTDWMKIAHDYGGYVIVFISMIMLFYLGKVVRCRDFRSMPES